MAIPSPVNGSKKPAASPTKSARHERVASVGPDDRPRAHRPLRSGGRAAAERAAGPARPQRQRDEAVFASGEIDHLPALHDLGPRPPRVLEEEPIEVDPA